MQKQHARGRALFCSTSSTHRRTQVARDGAQSDHEGDLESTFSDDPSDARKVDVLFFPLAAACGACVFEEEVVSPFA